MTLILFFCRHSIIVFFFDLSSKILRVVKITGLFNVLKTGKKGGNQAKTTIIYGKIKL